MGIFSNILSRFDTNSRFKIEEKTIEQIKGDELSRILDQKISGIIIKNFFNDKTFNIDFDLYDKKTTPFGFTTGIAILNSKPDLSDYLEENENFNNLIEKELSTINYRKTLEKVFSAIFYGKPAKVFSKEGRNFKISTLRVIEPDKGGIQEHIGNEFMFKSNQTEAIRKDTINFTQFSFFLVLQAPTGGGELILYNKYWKDTPDNIVESGSLISKKKERTEFLRGVERLPLKLEKGDLLIFDGGRIWHEVSGVEGKRPRITSGGFLAISKNKEEVYYWS